MIYIWVTVGDIPDMNAMALVFSIISGLQNLFFGMCFNISISYEEVHSCAA
ncbi:MAG: hypothetical protein JRJ15_09030 [Deltaproteobacteria bacterium]|nr:hypothetical protein [Deltaproteobacteria bacterium]